MADFCCYTALYPTLPGEELGCCLKIYILTINNLKIIVLNFRAEATNPETYPCWGRKQQ